LAERHRDLRDGIRGLLEATFETVFMVANEASLLEGAERLRPALVVIDISLAGGDLTGFLARVFERAPGSRVLLISVHDEGTGFQSCFGSRCRRHRAQAQSGNRSAACRRRTTRGKALLLARDFGGQRQEA